MGDAAAAEQQQQQQQQQLVARVLRARHAFEVLELSVAEQEEAAVKRAYHRLALILHPDKNPHEDAKVAFVRIADAYEQLRYPTSQRQALAALSKASAPASSPSSWRQQASAAAAGAARARKPRSFRDVMREWEEFEREWFEQEEAHKVVERQHRAEKKRSQMADRAERQAAERQRLANAVLEEDEETFEARSSSWASFLQGKGKAKRRKQGGGSMKVVKARREDRGLGTGV